MFKDKHCLIYASARLEIFTIKMKGKSFSLDWMVEESVVFSSTVNQIELWHKRLGHFNQETLVHIQGKKKDGAGNAKPGRRNHSLYLLSI